MLLFQQEFFLNNLRDDDIYGLFIIISRSIYYDSPIVKLS